MTVRLTLNTITSKQMTGNLWIAPIQSLPRFSEWTAPSFPILSSSVHWRRRTNASRINATTTISDSLSNWGIFWAKCIIDSRLLKERQLENTSKILKAPFRYEDSRSHRRYGVVLFSILHKALHRLHTKGAAASACLNFSRFAEAINSSLEVGAWLLAYSLVCV